MNRNLQKYFNFKDTPRANTSHNGISNSQNINIGNDQVQAMDIQSDRNGLNDEQVLPYKGPKLDNTEEWTKYLHINRSTHPSYTDYSSYTVNWKYFCF